METEGDTNGSAAPLWISLLLDWLSGHPRQPPRLG
ncbi:hypothetical protein ROTAS13_02724 [Roseomonas sp. TAS13]|uniref:Uncharacterized protein n=1 Tax=Roseomonas mucosa TaxID=207340 RepID=A0A379MXG0_9PROT|nr:hypothetical protein ROTAS13_02724 [Roseomonas sp. TAS13]SUE39095.1 Uncharacterised protein [Roseomonas mucosa]